MRKDIGLIHSALVSLAATGAAAAGTVVSVDVILAQGDVPAGGNGAAVSTLNAPFTDSANRVGFVAALDNGERAIWYDTGITFLSSDALPDLLTGGESTMGVSDTGGFIYSPSFNGADSVYTHLGLLLEEDTQAPDFPAGVNSTFHSRPRMYPGGQAYWVSGFNETGGTSTQGRMIYKSDDGTPGTISVVLRSDDIVAGIPIARPSGVDFDFDFSNDGNHHAQVLLLATGSTVNDGVVYVDGAVIAREDDPIDETENWDNFDLVSINNAANFIFTGDTNGATTTDEFIAYNGAIVVREGDIVDGVLLAPGFALRAASINNLGKLVHMWGLSSDEVLFVGDAAAPLGSRVVLRTLDDVDFDGDSVADATVTDFNASATLGPGLDLADDRFAYVEVDLMNIGDTVAYEAVIRVELFCGGDVDQDFSVDIVDLLALLGNWGDCPEPCPPTCAGDTNGDCTVDIVDLLELLSQWGDCP
jgi:hypothetical protein